MNLLLDGDASKSRSDTLELNERFLARDDSFLGFKMLSAIRSSLLISCLRFTGVLAFVSLDVVGGSIGSIGAIALNSS